MQDLLNKAAQLFLKNKPGAHFCPKRLTERPPCRTMNASKRDIGPAHKTRLLPISFLL